MGIYLGDREMGKLLDSATGIRLNVHDLIFIVPLVLSSGTVIRLLCPTLLHLLIRRTKSYQHIENLSSPQK